MAIDTDLLEKAYRAPQDVRFGDLVKLAEQLGFKEVGGQGGHRVFHHPEAPLIRDEFPRPLNLQAGRDGKAKTYQVKQMLQMAEAMNIIKAPQKQKET